MSEGSLAEVSAQCHANPSQQTIRSPSQQLSAYVTHTNLQIVASLLKKLQWEHVHGTGAPRLPQYLSIKALRGKKSTLARPTFAMLIYSL